MTHSTKLEAGAVLQNQYRLLECLGGGGMGVVWSAHHETLGHVVAVKVLHGHIMTASEPRARFEREARLMAQLGESSRHITRVMEHGVLPDGTPYLVMECLRGEALDVRLKRERVLPLGATAEIVTQLCRALGVAHAAGVVHRDIKPANVFLTQDDEGKMLVKLLDFGVAKAMAETAGEQTVSGQVIGTPNYMSPEQLTQDVPVDHRADLFAVGAIAYRCATGKTPFGKGSMSEMAMRILSATPKRPTTLSPSLPDSFDLFVERALAKNPLDRFQSARDLSDALNALVADVGASAHVPVVLPPQADVIPASSAHTGAGTTHSTPPSSAAQPPKRSGVGKAAVVLALLGVLAAAWFLRSRPSTPSLAAREPSPPVALSSPPTVREPPTVPDAPPSVERVVASVPSASASVAAAPPVSAAPSATSVAARRWTAPAAGKPKEEAPVIQDTWRKKDEM